MAWPQDAYVGQKVVFINEIDMGNYGIHKVPKLNDVYIIREILLARPQFIAFRLIEIVNSIGLDLDTNKLAEPYFSADRFRPVQTKSTEKGMAILKEILVTQKIKENV